MPRRRTGTLVDLEAAILAVGLERARDGERFHGFAIAQALGDGKRLVGHGTLYKALGRLHGAGLLDAEWEAPEIAESEGRPRRRLYAVTAAGAQALAAHRAQAPAVTVAGAPALGRA